MTVCSPTLTSESLVVFHGSEIEPMPDTVSPRVCRAGLQHIAKLAAIGEDRCALAFPPEGTQKIDSTSLTCWSLTG